MKSNIDRRSNKGSNSRSKAVAKSWKDSDIAARRANKEHVVVAGQGEFRSVKQAFENLGLPVGQHAKFRLELKEKRRATFRDDEGHKFSFRIPSPKPSRNH